jgi:hypothetical protein
MRKRLCAVGLVFLNSFGDGSLLLACGDKFVGAGRGTRFQQAPGGHQETILIYTNPASDVPTALARVSADATLRRAGYRPTTVATSADFERELSQGSWDLVLVGLADAQTVSQHAQNKAGILPVALKTTGAQLKQTKALYPVILTKAPATNDSFVHTVYDALASRFKNKAA